MDKPKCKLCGERHQLGPCSKWGKAAKEYADDPYRPSPAVAALKDARAVSELPMSVRAKVSAALVERRAQFAPPGQCECCDYRREKVAEAVRLHRAKARKITP